LSVGFWTEVVDRADAALGSGAMHSFECVLEFVEDAGVEFVLRVATKFPKAETAAPNPFASPEPALVVRDRLTPTHRVLLNKFSVLREHLLVVTREFEDQEQPLGERDFEALAICMEDAEVLAFYNGGTEAGASQRHKHLQVVTLPLSPRHSIPMDVALEKPAPALPFRCAFTRLPAGQVSRPASMASTYRELHRAARLEFPQPYNLLVTHEWMLVVPRSRDRFQDISINSLAFAGSYFVRDAKHAHVIAASKPMSVLASVAIP
jgi:ATP adenylyltransferase